MKTENNMRNFNKILFSFLPIFLVILFSQKNALATIYTINIPIEGYQEVPPNPSTGLGVLNGTYNSSTYELSFYINFTGLVSLTTAAHFHGPAMPGVIAPVQIGLVGFPTNVNAGAYVNTYILTADQNTQILSGLWYVNIHTHDYPGGEIRGRLNLYPPPASPPATIYTINIPIEGYQEVPPNPSTGLGVLNGTYNTSTYELSFYINFTGLVSLTTAAHFHGPAMPGVIAPVQIGLVGFPTNVNAGAYVNTYILTADQNTQILSGLWYVNIHTHVYPGGEIRGRLNLYPPPAPPPELSSPANNSTNNPLNITFIWNKVNTALSYRLQVSTDSLFFSLLVNDSTLIDSFKTISGFNYQTKYFWRVGSKKYSTGPTSYSSGWKFTTISMSIVSLKLLMEGMYNSVTNLLSRKDTVTLYLRNAVFPYALRDSVKRVIDSTTFSAQFTFPGIPTGQYYLVAKHHNCIETWSRIGGEPLVGNGTIYNYDFTFSKGRAFGQNMIQVDTSPNRFAIYSGDVNQDGVIDASDNGAIDNDAGNFATGYLSTDLNGDEVIDASDAVIADNNSANFVSAVTP